MTTFFKIIIDYFYNMENLKIKVVKSHAAHKGNLLGKIYSTPKKRANELIKLGLAELVKATPKKKVTKKAK